MLQNAHGLRWLKSEERVIELGEFFLLLDQSALLLLSFVVLAGQVDLQVDRVVRQQHPLVLFNDVHVVTLRWVLHQKTAE